MVEIVGSTAKLDSIPSGVNNNSEIYVVKLKNGKYAVVSNANNWTHSWLWGKEVTIDGQRQTIEGKVEISEAAESKLRRQWPSVTRFCSDLPADNIYTQRFLGELYLAGTTRKDRIVEENDVSNSVTMIEEEPRRGLDRAFEVNNRDIINEAKYGELLQRQICHPDQTPNIDILSPEVTNQLSFVPHTGDVYLVVVENFRRLTTVLSDTKPTPGQIFTFYIPPSTKDDLPSGLQGVVNKRVKKIPASVVRQLAALQSKLKILGQPSMIGNIFGELYLKSDGEEISSFNAEAIIRADREAAIVKQTSELWGQIALSSKAVSVGFEVEAVIDSRRTGIALAINNGYTNAATFELRTKSFTYNFTLAGFNRLQDGQQLKRTIAALKTLAREGEFKGSLVGGTNTMRFDLAEPQPLKNVINDLISALEELLAS